jgi:ubiquinone/menaquinone biosynthesis C-methylase UbiE
MRFLSFSLALLALVATLYFVQQRQDEREPVVPSQPPVAVSEPTPVPPPPAQPPASVAAVEPEPEPPAVTEYQGRTVAQTMHWKGAPWLQRQTREEEENGGLMREQLELKPGQTVCDLGSGDGYHTLWMASVVQETGKVYAVDIQPEMLEMLQKRAAGRGLGNIISTIGKAWDPMLPADSQDLILLVDVYHEFSHPEPMLKAMRKALKQSGRMVLVEFRSEDANVPIKPEHKMSKEQMLKEIPPLGFKLVKQFDALPWQHMMFFGRDDAP